MKTLYLECGMGAAGDMLTAALLEICEAPEDMLRCLNEAGLPGVMVTAEPSVKNGVRGTHMRVRIHGTEEISADDTNTDNHTNHPPGSGHRHGHLSDILHMIDHLRVSDAVKRHAKAVYALIAEAESAVHGVPVSDVHFHEVGTLDAIADITGFCLLMEKLKPESVLASPIALGSGFVKCAHGLLPVPAPATARLLTGLPQYSGPERGELCTPTGAALLRHFVDSFTPMPVMTVAKIGYGMGQKDFDRVNCVRAFWGETAGPKETVTELFCNLDDMTPEAIAFTQQLLMDAGALDVYTTPVVMKKGRPGILLACMCKNESADAMAALIFKHTTTLGLRVNETRRLTLRREMHTVSSPYGPVRVKTASGFGISKSKPEYEDIAALAREYGLPLAEITRSLEINL